MNTRTISVSLGADLHVLHITSIFTYSPEQLSCTTDPTRSTYWIQRQVNAQVGPMRQTSDEQSSLLASSIVQMVPLLSPVLCLHHSKCGVCWTHVAVLNTEGHHSHLTPPCQAHSFNGRAIVQPDDCAIRRWWVCTNMSMRWFPAMSCYSLVSTWSFFKIYWQEYELKGTEG